jgi:hypothetical protein
MDIFICDGDEQALERLIEQALNIPTEHHYGGRDKLHFELASHRVGFACIDVRRLRSKPAPGQRVKTVDPLPVDGVYAHQTEVAVMVQVKDSAGLPYWYLPYVLNSLPVAVTTGREIYGYPKRHATFTIDDDPPSFRRVPQLFGPERKWKQRVVVHAYDLVLGDNGDDEAEFALKPVLEFRQNGTPEADLGGGRPLEARAVRAGPRPDDFEIYPGRPTVAADAATADHGDVARSGTAVNGSASEPEVPQEEAGRAFLERIRSDVPYAFLRQFRDPEHESQASYQAIVMGRLVPDSSDNLRVAPPEEFSVVLPWAYNLALAEEIFGHPPRLSEDEPIPKPVVGLLTGENATFDVLRAEIVWQFGCENSTDESGNRR